MNCPRCHSELQRGTFGEADVSVCGDCLGMLVQQNRLIPLMQELSRHLEGCIDFDHPIEKADSDGGQAMCPRCGQPMERFGYMGTNLVHAWRCNRDAVLWGDTETLGVMAVLFARTRLRKRSRDAVLEVEQESLNRRVNALLRSRMRTNLVLFGRGM